MHALIAFFAFLVAIDLALALLALPGSGFAAHDAD